MSTQAPALTANEYKLLVRAESAEFEARRLRRLLGEFCEAWEDGEICESTLRNAKEASKQTV